MDGEIAVTAVEIFCMESIQTLGRPTVNEFTNFMRISPSNAAYKVNSLVKKGCVRKIQSDGDRLEEMLQIVSRELMPEVDAARPALSR